MKKVSRQIRAKGARCLTIVVAESYKCREDLLKDTEFYDQHFDRISLYTSDEMDLIISDDKTLPVDNWETRKDAWLDLNVEQEFRQQRLDVDVDLADKRAIKVKIEELH